MAKWILPLEKITQKDRSLAGGKGAQLGELMRAGFCVPPGFVILTNVFAEFMKDQEIPEYIGDEIKKHFNILGAEQVAVRSSASVEDRANASWAGQFDTYLNTNKSTLLKNIYKCWQSLFSDRVIAYREAKHFHKAKLSMAVIVQKMVPSEISGVAFSVHPVTQDKNHMIIEACAGLADQLVSGQITPDSYVVEKVTKAILEKNIRKKELLSDQKILELADIVNRIEVHFGFPCDVEWAMAKGKFYILQSRPITTLGRMAPPAEAH